MYANPSLLSQEMARVKHVARKTPRLPKATQGDHQRLVKTSRMQTQTKRVESAESQMLSEPLPTQAERDVWLTLRQLVDDVCWFEAQRESGTDSEQVGGGKIPPNGQRPQG